MTLKLFTATLGRQSLLSTPVLGDFHSLFLIFDLLRRCGRAVFARIESLLIFWRCRTIRWLERRTTSARTCGIRILDFKAAVIERIDKVDFASPKIVDAIPSDDDPNPIFLLDMIAIFRRCEAHGILETSTATTVNGEPKANSLALGQRLLSDQFSQLLAGVLGYSYHCSLGYVD